METLLGQPCLETGLSFLQFWGRAIISMDVVHVGADLGDIDDAVGDVGVCNGWGMVFLDGRIYIVQMRAWQSPLGACVTLVHGLLNRSRDGRRR